MNSVLNRLARPNDLAFREFGDLVQGYTAEREKPVKETKERPPKN